MGSSESGVENLFVVPRAFPFGFGFGFGLVLDLPAVLATFVLGSFLLPIVIFSLLALSL